MRYHITSSLALCLLASYGFSKELNVNPILNQQQFFADLDAKQQQQQQIQAEQIQQKQVNDTNIIFDKPVVEPFNFPVNEQPCFNL